MKTKLVLLCLLAAFCLPLGQAQAGDKDRRGTAGSEQLLIPVTARTASLGAGFTSGLGSASGLEGLFANPAALTVNAGTNALFSRVQYVADIGVNYFGIAQRFGSNQIALTVNTWDFGDIPLQTEVAPEISDVTWTANYTTVGATYAREFTDRISAGVTFKVVSERIDDVSSSGMAFDAGMTYVVGESGLRFGVSLKNFGPSREFSGTGLKRQGQLFDELGNPVGQPATTTLDGAEYELPSLLNFGVAYTRDLGESASVTLMSNFRSNSFASDQYSAGLELGLRNILFVRGGYEFQDDMDLTMYSGANFGAGLNLDLRGTALTVDYAYRATEVFEAINVITASITL
jgi:hypothetical protein